MDREEQEETLGFWANQVGVWASKQMSQIGKENKRGPKGLVDPSLTPISV